MNVEIGAEAALFPEKEYINAIAVAVWADLPRGLLQLFSCHPWAKCRTDAASVLLSSLG